MTRDLCDKLKTNQPTGLSWYPPITDPGHKRTAGQSRGKQGRVHTPREDSPSGGRHHHGAESGSTGGVECTAPTRSSPRAQRTDGPGQLAGLCLGTLSTPLVPSSVRAICRKTSQRPAPTWQNLLNIISTWCCRNRVSNSSNCHRNSPAPFLSSPQLHQKAEDDFEARNSHLSRQTSDASN